MGQPGVGGQGQGQQGFPPVYDVSGGGYGGGGGANQMLGMGEQPPFSQAGRQLYLFCYSSRPLDVFILFIYLFIYFILNVTKIKARELTTTRGGRGRLCLCLYLRGKEGREAGGVQVRGCRPMATIPPTPIKEEQCLVE